MSGCFVDDVDDLDRTVERRRLWRSGHRIAGISLVAMIFGANIQFLGTIVIGRLAANPSWPTVVVLAGCLLGWALLDTAGRTIWVSTADRADDDALEVGALARQQMWDALRTLFYTVPMWIVASLTWWPAWPPWRSPRRPALFASIVVAGIGLGAGLQGAFRPVIPLAPPG